MIALACAGAVVAVSLAGLLLLWPPCDARAPFARLFVIRCHRFSGHPGLHRDECGVRWP